MHFHARIRPNRISCMPFMQMGARQARAWLEVPGLIMPRLCRISMRWATIPFHSMIDDQVGNNW
jgi:hypothetical protein